MQILITHTSLKATTALHITCLQMLAGLTVLLAAFTLFAGVVYHVVALEAAREGWPMVGALVQAPARDGAAQRDRYLRENLDAMARRIGEMQARLIQLESMGERVSGLAGIKPHELQQLIKPPPAPAGGRGGPYVPLAGAPEVSSLAQLGDVVATLEARAAQSADVLILSESRLFETRLANLMVPNSRPVDVAAGSGFGFRADPFTGRAALHTGLDFPADSGAAIRASAGGVVQQVLHHPQYGLMVELDHGRGLVTRYAHASSVVVKPGDLVRRGDPIAEVGTTGRSTGPHLHFEVLVDGVPQDPSRFLAGGQSNPLPGTVTASAQPAR